MADAQTKPSDGKGKAFFDRAEEVADTGNWDFAIELYLEGIRREPDNIKGGHQPLREVALKRTAQGGKPAGMIDAIKHGGGKKPIDALYNAEYLLSKEPGSAKHMMTVIKAARALQTNKLTNWISRILLEVQRQSKPHRPTLMLLADAFQEIEEFASAIAACEMASLMKADDGVLNDRLNELSAKYTIKKGQYDKEGSFTKGVKNLEKQQELSQQDSLVKGQDYLRKQVDRAREGYLEATINPGKINSFADALLKTQDEGDENEAIDVLAKAHKETGAYQFKVRIGDIRIRQMVRRYRKLLSTGDKAGAVAQAKKQLAFELEEFTDRAENYPTDLGIKFELGKRLFLAGKWDDAIGALQQAQRDPRRHIHALNYLGQAFARKGWFQEASETYERALKAEMSEDRKKDLYYNLGDTYEKMGELQKSQNLFSDLAQLDFNYRDTRHRLDAVRKALDEAGK